MIQNRPFICIWPSQWPLFSTPSVPSPQKPLLWRSLHGKAMKRVSLHKVQGEDLPLHSANAALCSRGRYFPLFTSHNATWPLQLTIGPHEWGGPGGGYLWKRRKKSSPQKFEEQPPRRQHASRKVKSQNGGDRMRGFLFVQKEKEKKRVSYWSQSSGGLLALFLICTQKIRVFYIFVIPESF